MKRFLYILFSVCILDSVTLFSVQVDDVYVIGEKSLEYRHVMRVNVTTSKSEKIATKLRRIPLNYFSPDGSAVKKGDIIAEFDREQLEYERKRQTYDLGVIDAKLRTKLMGIDNDDLALVEKYEGQEDTLAQQEAKLAELRAEPRPDDVRIAEGKLKIADLNLRLAKSDYDRAQRRFQRGMISRAELDSAAKVCGENQVKYDYASKELELTLTRPGLAYEIARTELAVKNSKLELEKLRREIQEQETLSAIQKRGAQQRKKRKLHDIEEKDEDLANTKLYAPISGYVSHRRIDGNSLALGMRLHLNRIFMEIPDMDTIGFEGVLQESVRRFFAPGDKVIVRVQGQLDRPLLCELNSISTLSKDLSENNDHGWNQSRKYGVNVFDVTIRMTQSESTIQPGMTGMAELIASKPVSGPAVPLKYVRLKSGKHYLIVNGEFERVNGVVCDGWYILDDAKWLGKKVGMRSKYTLEVDRSDDGRLTASGELEPVHKTDVVVGDIGWWPWPKVLTLVPDEQMVKKGEVIATLDPSERIEQIERLQTRLTEIRSSLEECLKNSEIIHRSGEYDKTMAKNNQESKRLTMEEVNNDSLRPLTYFAAVRDRDLAKIRLQDTERKLARERAKKSPTLSPVEMKRLLRDFRRNQLRLERAELKLEEAGEGTSPVKRSRARLDYLEARANSKQKAKSAVFRNASARRRQQSIKNNLARQERWLKLREKQRDNHVIHAPADGLICYNKIWSDGMYKKPGIGSSVGPRYRIMSIPDLHEMEVKVEVPEHYYPQVKIGMPVEVRVPSLSDDMLPGQVAKIDLLFFNKGKKDSQLGLYSGREPLGEVVFNVRVRFQSKGLALKPGLISEVFFPFKRQ